jgi:hypothetical protein
MFSDVTLAASACSSCGASMAAADAWKPSSVRITRTSSSAAMDTRCEPNFIFPQAVESNIHAGIPTLASFGK